MCAENGCALDFSALSTLFFEETMKVTICGDPHNAIRFRNVVVDCLYYSVKCV